MGRSVAVCFLLSAYDEAPPPGEGWAAEAAESADLLFLQVAETRQLVTARWRVQSGALWPLSGLRTVATEALAAAADPRAPPPPPPPQPVPVMCQQLQARTRYSNHTKLGRGMPTFKQFAFFRHAAAALPGVSYIGKIGTSPLALLRLQPRTATA